MNAPRACRPSAFTFFAAQLPILETTEGLLNAAIAVEMHADDSILASDVIDELDDIAAEVSSRTKSKSTSALLAHLHEVLFEELGFCGNTQEYYDPRNSYLTQVLRRHTGLPIALALIYKVVAEKIGLYVEGLNSPGHFLARVDTEGEAMIIDPFFGGKILTREEAFKRIEEATQQELPRDVSYLLPATHHQWIARMLTNLLNIFAASGCEQDMAAMTELQTLLLQNS